MYEKLDMHLMDVVTTKDENIIINVNIGNSNLRIYRCIFKYQLIFREKSLGIMKIYKTIVNFLVKNLEQTYLSNKL